MRTLQKPMAVLVSVLLLSFLFLSVLLTGVHAYHDCVQPECCSICIVLHSIQSVLRRILACLLYGSALAVVLCVVLAFTLCTDALPKTLTLITLKVRLNP